MTTHPIDPEALRRKAADSEVLRNYTLDGDSTVTENVLALLDALAAAEHRATRAEGKIPEEKALRMRAVAAVTEAEADRDEWRQAALEERAGLLDALEQIKAREARIKAVREVLSKWMTYCQHEQTMRALEEVRQALEGGSS